MSESVPQLKERIKTYREAKAKSVCRAPAYPGNPTDYRYVEYCVPKTKPSGAPPKKLSRSRAVVKAELRDIESYLTIALDAKKLSEESSAFEKQILRTKRPVMMLTLAIAKYKYLNGNISRLVGEMTRLRSRIPDVNARFGHVYSKFIETAPDSIDRDLDMDTFKEVTFTILKELLKSKL